MEQQKRGQWASNLGFVLAAAGSAVGLGNIWKFPGKAGANGGGAFVLVYLAVVFTVGLTVMLAELTIGRHAHKNAVGAIRSVSPRSAWIGVLGVLAGFVILSYYSVVGGWVLKYIAKYLTGADFGASYAAYYEAFTAKPLEPVLWHLLFLLFCVLVILRGVSGGIEKIGKVLMPGLFILLIVIAVRAVTLEGASEGVRFLLRPDFSQMSVGGVVSALGQAFFSLSLGMGVMATYGSYVSKDDNLYKSALTICTLDSLVAIIAAFAVIPAVFATGTDLGMGGGFAFISLPGIFDRMPGGFFFGLLFFVMLLFAALTSAISIMEGTVAFASEELHLSRRTAVFWVAGLCGAVGICYSLAHGALPLTAPWFDFRHGFRMLPLSVWMEFFTDNLLMPLGGLAFCIFVGWIWGAGNAVAEVEQEGRFRFVGKQVFRVFIRWICPAAIAVILLFTVGLGVGLS